MKYQLIIRLEAEEDIQSAFQWYENCILGLGREFIHSLDAVFRQIQRSPTTYPIVYREVRRTLMPKFPFSIFYTQSGTKVVVLSVHHVKRDPGRWKKRK